MSIRTVILICLVMLSGFPRYASGTEAIKDVSGQWDLTIKSGQQEVHGYMMIRQYGNVLKGGGRDHGEFELRGGHIDATKDPPQIEFRRQYTGDSSKDLVTFTGELQASKDGPGISGTYTVPHKPGETAAKIQDSWNAVLLEPMHRESMPTFVGATDFILQGEMQLNEGSYRMAVRNFTEAIEMNPKDALPYRFRGTAYSKLGEHRKAIDDYTAGIKLSPKEAPLYTNRGNSHAALAEYSQAVSDYTRAIEIDPDYGNAYRQRGLSEFARGHYQNAAGDFGKALEHLPDDAILHYHRGLANFKLGLQEAAVEDFNKAVAINPKDAKAFYERGRVHALLNRKDDAIQDFTQSINLDPTNKSAYSQRGASYLRRALSFGPQSNSFADAFSAIEDYARGMTQTQLMGALGLAIASGAALALLKLRKRRRTSD